MKKQIYWLHSHFLLSTGGTRFVFEVINQLKKNYQITILVEKSSPLWIKKYKKIGIEVKEFALLTSNNLIYWLFFPFFLCLDYLKLKSLIPQNSIIISSMFPMN
ncbi:MAG: hypothetical protein PVJ09_05045, partial [Candidatus Woesebacteria bacterium]